MRMPFIIAALHAVLEAENEHEQSAATAGCRVCGKTAKRDTGECDNCGVHVCKFCGGFHIGPPPDEQCAREHKQ